MTPTLERAFAVLYLDADLRAGIRRGEPAAMSQLGLEAADLADLRQFLSANEPAFEFFANLLDENRVKVLRRLTEHSRKIVGADIYDEALRTHRFVRGNAASLVPEEDCSAFMRLIVDVAARMYGAISLERDVCMYERAFLHVTLAPSNPASKASLADTGDVPAFVQVVQPALDAAFTYDVSTFLASGELPSAPSPHTLHFFRDADTRTVRLLKIGAGLARAFEAGSRSVAMADLVDTLHAASNRLVAPELVVKQIEKLLRLRVLAPADGASL